MESCLESMRKMVETQLVKHDIKCTVTSRVKAVDSLRKRLYEKVEKINHHHQTLQKQELSDADSSSNQMLSDSSCSWSIWGLPKWDFDLFGLRIALYFPEQRREVLELFDHKETAQFERKGKESMENGKVNYAYIDDRDGANSDTDGNNALNSRPFNRSVNAKDTITDHQGAVERRFRGYTEELRYVSFTSKQEHLPKPFDELWVEVQVRSVMMDAYTNISHGLEYKALTGILSDEEIQVLESINGLAQTGEVLLQHLQHIHQERVRSDQNYLEYNEIIPIIAQYMGLKDPAGHRFPFPEDHPFSIHPQYTYALQRFLRRIVIITKAN